ncbi:hypothetical protein PHJA_002960400 [Phtheirospermum japonicum]|uniref:Uncharacterized protein n=1 Tax=Phtheirospermum japonicum TaxID=374723 RepID=A0A830DL40_9LAMI|nr:hypothetical protein PHJA_002960400 [Phtheirospermum japonicum]
MEYKHCSRHHPLTLHKINQANSPNSPNYAMAANYHATTTTTRFSLVTAVISSSMITAAMQTDT